MKDSILKHYWFALALTAAVFIGVFFKSGVGALWPVTVLAIIELTFSFDNAVLNSEILGKMSRIWRTIFLTVGIAIAVFGVRLVMPIVLVSLTTHQAMGQVVDQALHHPSEYAHHLHAAYPLIAAFGGIFLLMIGLRFLAEDRETKWLHAFEHNIARARRPWLIPIGGAIVASFVVFLLHLDKLSVTIAALLGGVMFVLIKLLSEFIESRQPKDGKTQSTGWVNFLYLELLDATFSFDGVIAAFAITTDVILIAAGLGIGALFVRSITVHLLESGTLAEYRYLIHGAHYAIATLGIMLIASSHFEIPDILTGLSGVTIIALSLVSSIRKNRAEAHRIAS